LGNPIKQGTFYSTRFFIPNITDRVYLKDNSAGIIQLIVEKSDGTPLYSGDVGTINYATGSWTVPSLSISQLYDSILEFVFTPSSNDVVSSRNVLVNLPNDRITVNIITDSIASGAETSGEKFIFSTVR
jgi:hypothetical protein